MMITNAFDKAIQQAVEQARATGRRQRVKKDKAYSKSSHLWWTVREIGT